MAKIPASIRYKNPGAMWGGNAVSKKWGETGNVALADGTGQGNKIAVFPTYVQGICAQIDLWRTARYRNKPFKTGIAMWSGGNSVPQYIALIKKRVPGMTGDTLMTDDFLKSEMGLQFLKAQAFHEAGREYPATDAEFREAQAKVFGLKKPTVVVVKKPLPEAPQHVGVWAGIGAAVYSAYQYLHDHWAALTVFLVIIGLAASSIISAKKENNV